MRAGAGGVPGQQESKGIGSPRAAGAVRQQEGQGGGSVKAAGE